MNLHQNKNSFAAAIQTTSDKLNILPVFVEKDYWITLVLKRLAESKYNESVVFKGGTSLSKGFKLIDRFSEDIDIAIINPAGRPGNQIKTLIREIEKKVSIDLNEITDSTVSSKGSRFRKSVYSYETITDKRFYQGTTAQLIIEINSFANPVPFESKRIESLISTVLYMNNQPDLISRFDLSPFSIKVLTKNQTLVEKMVSLFRSSFEADTVTGLNGKIRHFYDLHFLLLDEEVRVFVDSMEFLQNFNEVWSHDQKAFDEPEDWCGKSAIKSPLYFQWPALWEDLAGNYQKELSALAFSKIPESTIILDSMTYLLRKLTL